MKHKLAVIIVNYNVAFFLEQCLHSVIKASESVDTEIWVVDNDSKDGSVEMVKNKFPDIHLIDNKDNLGFSKANNQAIKLCNSEYVLLLNPDTVVEEETFSRIISFMDSHPNAGGLGVKMIDGKGLFLPESKRGLPTPAVAFYKIFGLAKLFPKSRKFGKYHLGFLDKDKTHKVDILSGAFMLMRQTVLDKTGLLDETFFMYGEDIDLSYRITKAGYDNYYFADTSIIHYKGESTKKSSVNYIFVFYKAMAIFAEKHFSSSNAKLFSFLINIAIWFRAGVALLHRFVKWITIPLLDLAYIQFGLYFIKNLYENYSGIKYSGELYPYAFLAYGVVWVISMYFNGGYDRPIALKKNIIGLFYGTGLILILYALLPENLRFSRAIILFGSVFSIVITLLTRYLYSLILSDYKIKGVHQDNFLIIGQEDEISRIHRMLNNIKILDARISSLPLVGSVKEKQLTLNTISDLVQFKNINEVIFCAKDISAQDIIHHMSIIKNPKIHFKIAPPESLFIIGSNSANKSGDFLSFDISSINTASNRRNKRTFDLITSLTLLLTIPVSVWFFKQKINFIKNTLSVISGKKTWVGYDLSDQMHTNLPKIKKGISPPYLRTINSNPDYPIIKKSNLIYSKDYSMQNDLHILIKNWKHLDL